MLNNDLFLKTVKYTSRRRYIKLRGELSATGHYHTNISNYTSYGMHGMRQTEAK